MYQTCSSEDAHPKHLQPQPKQRDPSGPCWTEAGQKACNTPHQPIFKKQHSTRRVKWQDSAPNFKRNSASLPSSSPATPLRPGSLSTQGADSTVESSQVSTLGSGFRKAPFRTFHVRTDAHKSYLRKHCNAFPPTCLQKRRSRSLCSRIYSLTNLR